MKPSVVLLFLSGILFQTTIGLDLSDDGGYSFVVAVDKDTPQPQNVAQYIGNIKRSLQEFSNNLFLTTERFHVKSADILIPDTWTVEDAEEADITASYESSEVRLSERIKYASVDNPNPCGLSGDHISLPFSFFTDVNSGQYGIAWKALLPLWARYRWGAWEEHGHVGSSRYPYFSKAEVNSRDWQATGCSNEELFGRYVNLNGEECDMNPSLEPDRDCRFQPNHLNNATSSLMHFHWLDSVTKFCDATTHNQFSPNRQNLLCDQKSVLEIMRESSDYEAVTSPPNDIVEIDLIQFRTLKQSTTPYLYFLIDKARPQVDVSILNTVVHGLFRLFQPNEVPEVIAGLGTFPVISPVDGATLNAEIPFAEMESNIDEFVQKFEWKTNEGDEVRDFASPLMEAVRNVRAKRPAGGGIIIFLKVGGADLTPSMPFEAATAAMLRNEHIKLISMELGATHLANFHEKAGGILYSPTSVPEAEEAIEDLLRTLKAELDKKVDLPTQNVETVLNANVNRNTPVQVEIPEHVTNVEAQLVLPATSSGTATILVDGRLPNYTISNDWSMSGTSLSRKMLTVIEPLDVGEEKNWSFTYACEGTGCPATARFLIYGVSDRGTASKSGVQTADPNIEIAVSTSAQNNEIDFAKTTSSLSPFGIYAKVTQGGFPVRNAIVRAFLEDQEDDTLHQLDLLDNGFGTPDVNQWDGVYSGNFIPAKDGAYKLYVSAENTPLNVRKDLDLPARGSSQRLLPIDQTEDEDDAVDVNEEFLQNVQLPKLISVINTNSIPPDFANKPFKILDASAQPKDDGIILSFTIPQTVGSSMPENLRYDVYAAAGIDSLDVILLDQVGQALPGSPTTRTISVSRALLEGQEFLAIKSKNGAVQSEFSNILKMGEEPPVVTPEPTDPPTPDPTGTPPTGSPPTPGPTDSPTTPGPTDDPPTPGSTSAPEDDDKPFFKTAGGIVVIILIVLIIAGAIGGGVFFYMKKRNQKAEFNKLVVDIPPNPNTV